MTFVLAILLTGSAPAAAPTPHRTDLFGDPLPAGALARMGTVRLRHTGLSDFVSVSNTSALTTGIDRVLRFWDLTTGKQIRSVLLGGSGEAGHLMTLSPDGKTLVAERDGLLLFWDVATGREIARLPQTARRLNYLYFSPDGATLAVGEPEDKVILREWKTDTRRVLELPFVDHPGGFREYSSDSSTHCTFSPDGKWVLAQANSREPLGVFDFATGRLVHRLVCHASTFAVSPDSKTIVVFEFWINEKGDRKFSLRFIDLKTGKEVKRFPFKVEPMFYSLAFSPDGKQLACGGSEESRVLDVASGRELYRLTGRTRTMAYTPDGKRLLASTGYGLRVWDAVTGRELLEQVQTLGARLATAISPDGTTLATADWLDPTASLWDMATGRLVRRLPLGGEKRYVRDLSFSHHGKTLTAAQAMGFLQAWDVASAKVVQSIQLGGLAPPQRGSMYCYRFHVARDGRTVSTAERLYPRGVESTRLGRWELPTGHYTPQLTLTGEQRSCAWRADGKAVALFTPDGMTTFDLVSGAKCFQAKGTKGSQVQWSRDDRFLAGNRPGDGSVTLWEVATGGEVTTVKTGRVDHFTVAADNRLLVTADNQTLRVWDLVTGSELGRRSLSAHTTVVTALLVTPDGRRAFTALRDGTGLVWDLSFAERRSVPKRDPDGKVLSAWWDDLAGADASRAFAAAWRFADLPPDKVLPFLRARVRPSSDIDAKALAKHVDNLDSDDFAAREKASKALEALGPVAIPAMRTAADKTPSPEVKRRLRMLLNKAASAAPPAEMLRQVRAVMVLEGMKQQAGRPLLVELAKGAPQAPLMHFAKEALNRMKP